MLIKNGITKEKFRENVERNRKEFADKYVTNVESYSFIDMIMDSKKRNEVYEYYDSKYKETDEEKEIFEAWQNRRTGRRDKNGKYNIQAFL